MSRFQRMSLLIGALIVVLLIALVAVTAFRAPVATVVVTGTPALSVTDMTHTRIAVVYQTAVANMTETQVASTPHS